MSWKPSGGSRPEGQAERPEDERELADLGEADRDRQGDPQPGSRTTRRSTNFAIGLPKTTSTPGGDRQRHARRGTAGSSEHADRHEEQHGEGVAQRQGIGRGLVAQVDSPTTAPARKAPSANETPKTVGRHVRDPERDGEHRQGEQLASSPRSGTRFSSHGTSRASGHDHDDREEAALPRPRATLAEGPEELSVGRRGRAAEERRDGREQDEDDDRHEVLDDEPADGDPALGRVELATVRDRPAAARPCWPPTATSPRTSAPPIPQPSATPSSRPRIVAITIWMSAPGIAIPRTAARSRSEKWMPTPNISRMIPMSAARSRCRRRR